MMGATGAIVSDEIETELVVKRRIDRLCRTDQEQRIAVSRRAHCRFGADIAAGTRAIFQ